MGDESWDKKEAEVQQSFLNKLNRMEGTLLSMWRVLGTKKLVGEIIIMFFAFLES